MSRANLDVRISVVLDPAMRRDHMRLVYYDPNPRRTMFIHDGHAIDAFVGSRTWRCEPRNGEIILRSVFEPDTEWPAGQPIERKCLCAGRGSYLGGDNHSCGIYSWPAGYIETVDDGARLRNWLDFSRFIHGEVYLWGEVVRHARGYRAQFAMPASFYVWGDMPERLYRQTELAAIQYGVPLVTFAERGA